MIGVPTLRLTGDYYAIASIGLGEAIRLILENWQSFTRGARGFPGIDSYTTRNIAVVFFTVLTKIMPVFDNQQILIRCDIRMPAADFQCFLATRNKSSGRCNHRQSFDFQGTLAQF